MKAKVVPLSNLKPRDVRQLQGWCFPFFSFLITYSFSSKTFGMPLLPNWLCWVSLYFLVILTHQDLYQWWSVTIMFVQAVKVLSFFNFT
jgi:hypothetical protein